MGPLSDGESDSSDDEIGPASTSSYLRSTSARESRGRTPLEPILDESKEKC